MNKIKEEYEYSELYEYTMEHVMSEGKEWRKLYTPILFDTNLTLNDKSIYLALLSKVYKIGHMAKKNKNSNKEEVYKGITQKELGEITSTHDCNVGRSIDRLIENKYITTKMKENTNTFHLLNMVKEDGSKETFLPIPIDYFYNLSVNKKLFIDTIKVILLSYGNDRVPSMKSCQQRFELLSKKEYYRLKKLHDGSSDVTLYKNLINVEILNDREDVLANIVDNEFTRQFEDLLNLDIPMEEEDEDEDEVIEPILFETSKQTIEIPTQQDKEVDKDLEELEALLDS